MYPIPSLHPVWLGATIMRPWGCTLSCSSQPCTTCVTSSSPRHGYLWHCPSGSLARMPKPSWVTVSPGLCTWPVYSLFTGLEHSHTIPGLNSSRLNEEQEKRPVSAGSGKLLPGLVLVNYCMCLTDLNHVENLQLAACVLMCSSNKSCK